MFTGGFPKHCYKGIRAGEPTFRLQWGAAWAVSELGKRMQMEKAMSGRNSRKQAAFDIRKATAATALLVAETGESMYPVMKMLYLADKLHLERYGRFIAGDTYSAMEKGPVPSQTYDLVKHLQGRQSVEEAELFDQYLAYGENHQLTLKQSPDLDELSDSEVECLREVVEIYKRLGKWAVRDLSHDEAWKKAWGSRYFAKSIPMGMAAIAEGFRNADLLLEHLRDPEPGAAL